MSIVNLVIVLPRQVSFDVFLEVLAQYHLKLEKKLLAAFLSRCAVQARRDGVPYRDFLHRFQDRSEVGMTHNILTNTKHRLVRLLVIKFYSYSGAVGVRWILLCTQYSCMPWAVVEPTIYRK